MKRDNDKKLKNQQFKYFGPNKKTKTIRKIVLERKKLKEKDTRGQQCFKLAYKTK